MRNEEQDTIAHLLQVEEEAAELIREAQSQSDKEISDAKTQAQNDFESRYQSLASQMEEDFNKKIQEIDGLHKNQIEQYKSQIEQTPKDQSAFDALLKKIL